MALYSVSWSPDGSQLAASGANGAVYLYDYAKGVVVKKWQLHTQMSLKVGAHAHHISPNCWLIVCLRRLECRSRQLM